jgi:hypothetical protein
VWFDDYYVKLQEKYPTVNFILAAFSYSGTSIASDAKVQAYCAKMPVLADSYFTAFDLKFGSWPPVNFAVWDASGKPVEHYQTASSWSSDWRTTFATESAKLDAKLATLTAGGGGGTTAPPAATCTDAIKNQGETLVDCGGPNCPACPSFNFIVSDWSTCTKECGGGVMTRTVKCEDAMGNNVAVSNCEDKTGHDGKSQVACNVDPCPTYEWKEGTYGACNVECGQGKQFRPIECESVPLNGAPTKVADSFCSTAGKPSAEKVCDTGKPCTLPRWSSGAFGECDAVCLAGTTADGTGKQLRAVTCLDATDQPTGDANCAGTKPAETQPCSVKCNYKYSACAWSECTAACGGEDSLMSGLQSRQVFCVDENDKVVDNTICYSNESLQRPLDFIEGCNMESCEDNNWMTTTWGECIDNKRTRTAHCHLADGANAADDKCPPASKPFLSKECQVNVCDVVVAGQGVAPDGGAGIMSPAASVAVQWGAVALAMLATFLRV